MATRRVGQDTKIRIDTSDLGCASASATWVNLTFERECSISWNTDTEDSSVKGDSGWTKDAITGNSWSISCEVVFDPGDSLIAFLHTKLKTQAYAWVSYITDLGGSTIKEGAQAVVSKFDVKYPNKSQVTASVEFKMQGAPIASAV